MNNWYQWLETGKGLRADIITTHVPIHLMDNTLRNTLLGTILPGATDSLSWHWHLHIQTEVSDFSFWTISLIKVNRPSPSHNIMAAGLSLWSILLLHKTENGPVKLGFGLKTHGSTLHQEVSFIAWCLTKCAIKACEYTAELERYKAFKDGGTRYFEIT